MKRVIATAVVFVSIAAHGQAQKDIDLVKKDYYTIPYALQLSVVADAAESGETNAGRVASRLAAVPDISLAEITAGETAQILESSLADFLTVPEPGQDILFAEVDPEAARPGALRVYWGPITHQAPTAKTVGAWLGNEAAMFPRYVTAAVTVSFQRRTMTYRALYLIRADGSTFAADVMMESVRYSAYQGYFAPDALLHSKGRDNPVVRDWLSAHAVDATDCDGVCCVGSHCGIRRSDLQRQMAEPIRDVTAVEPPVRSHHALLQQAAMPSFAGEGGCSDYTPQYCVCDYGVQCTELPPPYSIQPSVTCYIAGLYRKVFWNGVWSGAYHTWLQSYVRYNSALSYESFDAGPTGQCVDGTPTGFNCGYLNDCALASAFGCLVGDIASNSARWWNSLSAHWDNETTCDSVVDMQNFEWNFRNNTIAYSWGGPNSNSFVYEMMDSTEGGLIPKPNAWVPGWGNYF